MIPHFHCPNDCESPQPFEGDDGVFWCGRCLHEGRGLVAVFVCTPELCDDGEET